LLRSLGPTLPLQGTRIRPTLGAKILFPLHKFPLDWVRRPDKPFSECRLTLEPIPESIFSDDRFWRWWRRLDRREDAALPEAGSWRPFRLLLEGRRWSNFKWTVSEPCFSKSVASWYEDKEWSLTSSKRSPVTTTYILL
jgi:hypothetical protein